MAQVIYTRRALADLDRFFEFLEDDVEQAGLALSAITEAISILERHPLIGRPAEHALRELIISRGKSGYIALYRYLPAQETVLILTLRHQKEAGYVED